MKKVLAVGVLLVVAMLTLLIISDDARAVLAQAKSGKWALAPTTKRDHDSTTVVRIPVFEAGRGIGCGARGVMYGANTAAAFSTNGAATRDSLVFRLYSYNGSIRTLIRADTFGTVPGSKLYVDSSFATRYSRELALEILVCDSAGTQDSLAGTVQWVFNLIGE